MRTLLQELVIIALVAATTMTDCYGSDNGYPRTTGTGTYLDPFVTYYSAQHSFTIGSTSETLFEPFQRSGIDCVTVTSHYLSRDLVQTYDANNLPMSVEGHYIEHELEGKKLVNADNYYDYHFERIVDIIGTATAGVPGFFPCVWDHNLLRTTVDLLTTFHSFPSYRASADLTAKNVSDENGDIWEPATPKTGITGYATWLDPSQNMGFGGLLSITASTYLIDAAGAQVTYTIPTGNSVMDQGIQFSAIGTMDAPSLWSGGSY